LLAVDDAQIRKFEEEAERLKEMLASFKDERKQARYVPLVGLALAIPSYFWKPWAPALVLVCAFVMMFTWWYLIFGHVNERTFQLEEIEAEIARARELLNNPEAAQKAAAKAEEAARAPVRVKGSRF
jgi:hypothetical protein